MTNLRRIQSSRASLLRRFAQDEQGASAVEYGLLASLLAAAIIGVVTSLGGKLQAVFSRVNAGMVNT